MLRIDSYYPFGDPLPIPKLSHCCTETSGRGLLGGYGGWGCVLANLETLGIAYAMDKRRSNEDNKKRYIYFPIYCFSSRYEATEKLSYAW